MKMPDIQAENTTCYEHGVEQKGLIIKSLGLNCNSVFAVLFSFSKGLFLTLTTSAMTVVVGCKD